MIRSLVVVASLVLAACGTTTGSADPTGPARPTVESSVRPPSIGPSPSGGSGSPGATGATGFAFEAEDVLAYYDGEGYTCTDRQPSATAAGFFVRTCALVDDDGRTRVIGVVTDPDGGLADGFASVQGTSAETFLAPIDALDPLAGFLGAMLGEDQGAGLLTWLAGHLGDEYAETTAGLLRVATYIESDVDRSRLYVEVANQAYLGAPGVEGP